MDFISGSFLLFLAIGLVVYYSTPQKWQQYLLLLLSVLFYASFSVKLFLVMLLGVAISYAAAWGISVLSRSKSNEESFYGGIPKRREDQDKAAEKESSKKQTKASRQAAKWLLAASICALAGMLLVLKFAASASPLADRLHLARLSFLVPVGISFYTLQMIAYLADLYAGKCGRIKNPFTYLLFITYFPQILQGPIPRADVLPKQLAGGHRFDYEMFVGGFELMLWGYFQKLVIADRANIMVNRLFGEYEQYPGAYMLVAAVLYSIQLYTDFNGCVCIARGVSEMFGIRLSDNFNHPYFATSIQDFWHRWHMTLSSWLKDYVYIPLGGSRRGTARRYVNIMITFLVSGVWHGCGLTFLVWGLLHGAYQVVGRLLMPVRDFAVKLFKVDRKAFSHTLYKQTVTFALAAAAWVFFRASSVTQAVTMLRSMVTVFNPWVLWDGSLCMLGLNERNVRLLVLAILLLWAVSMLQERFCLRQLLLKQGLVFRYALVIFGALAILIFGIYGPGYDAAAFIYGGF